VSKGGYNVDQTFDCPGSSVEVVWATWPRTTNKECDGTDRRGRGFESHPGPQTGVTPFRCHPYFLRDAINSWKSKIHPICLAGGTPKRHRLSHRLTGGLRGRQLVICTAGLFFLAHASRRWRSCGRARHYGALAPDTKTATMLINIVAI
jgi:hypothetical protein